MRASTPVLFIHGLWLPATSWTPWIELFGDCGYDATAPGRPGDPDTVQEARAHPERLADHGIDDVVEHYAAASIATAVPARSWPSSFCAIIPPMECRTRIGLVSVPRMTSAVPRRKRGRGTAVTPAALALLIATASSLRGPPPPRPRRRRPRTVTR